MAFIDRVASFSGPLPSQPTPSTEPIITPNRYAPAMPQQFAVVEHRRLPTLPTLFLVGLVKVLTSCGLSHPTAGPRAIPDGGDVMDASRDAPPADADASAVDGQTPVDTGERPDTARGDATDGAIDGADASEEAPDITMGPEVFVDLPERDSPDAAFPDATRDAAPDMSFPDAPETALDGATEDVPTAMDGGLPDTAFEAGLDVPEERPSSDAGLDAASDIGEDASRTFSRPGTAQFFARMDEISGSMVFSSHAVPPPVFATLTGGMRVAMGFSGNGINLSATGDKIVANSPTYGSFSGDFGMAAWIQLGTAGSARTIFARRAAYALRIDGMTGELQFSYNDGSCTLSSGATRITDANFHHVALARTGDRMDLYVDGLSAGSATGCSRALTSSDMLFLGASQAGGSSNNLLQGTIDQAYAWEGRASQRDVQDLICADQLEAGASLVSLAAFCR